MSTLRFKYKKEFLVYLTLIFYLVYVFYMTKPLNLNSNCGFDGSLYCKIALGEIVFEPYSRRTFLPKLISLFPITADTVYIYFYVINLFIIIATLFIIYLFFAKLKNNNFIYIFILVIFNPNFLRMLESMPVMLDFLALFLTLVYFFIYYTKKEKKLFWVLIGVITILAFTRENLPILLTFSTFIYNIISNWKNFKKEIYNFLYFVYAICITYVSFKQASIAAPTYVPNTDLNNVLIYWFLDIFKTTDDFFRFIYLFFIGLSLIGITSLISWKQFFGETGYIYIFSFLNVFSGLILGGDTARIMFIPFVTLALIYLLNKKMNSFSRLIIWLSVISWNPLQYSDGTEDHFLKMYGQRYIDFAVYEQQLQQIVFWSIVVMIIFLFFEALRQHFRQVKS